MFAVARISAGRRRSGAHDATGRTPHHGAEGHLGRRAVAGAPVGPISAVGGDDRGVALVELADDDIVEAVLEGMRSAKAVVSADVLRRSDRGALVQFETTAPLLLIVTRRSGVPLELPVDLVDGEIRREVAASRERLSELGDTLSQFGVRFVVEAVHCGVDAAELLTDHQHRLLEAAVEHGYRDTPRGCTLTELAERLNIAKSTCSGTLHRAEEAVIKRFLADGPLDGDAAG